MKLRFSFWSILLHLLAAMCFHGSGAREMVAPKIPMDDIPEGVNVLQLHSMDIERENLQHPVEKERLNGHVHDHERDHVHVHDHERDHVRVHDHARDHVHDHERDHVHDHARDHGQSSSSSSQLDTNNDLDPSVVIIFTMKDLKRGKTLPVYFEKQDTASTPPPWLQSKEEADSIPFSSAQLPYLLEFFSFSPGSLQAQAMESTLGFCERGALKGEYKFCATSKESMLDHVESYFGVDSKYLRALSTSYLTNNSTSTTSILQNYTILEEPKEIPAHPKMLACHTMTYPYIVYYCHFPGGVSKVFEVPLQGQNGERVDAVAICHLDTSSWSSDNVAFRSLGFKHGSPVCHFFPSDNLVWVPNPTTLD